MEENTYGFIGVGNMGTPMAIRLREAGNRVVVYDPNADAIAALANHDIESTDSPTMVAEQARTIFLSLPTPEIVSNVVMGPDGIIAGKMLRTVVDFSTIGPQAAVRVAGALADRNITYVDSPVSGGVPGARAGTLAVMVSCPNAIFTELQSVLTIFGKVFHLGEGPGQAQTMKLVNNLLSAAAIAVSSEAMVMGVKAGLDPKVMLDVINAGSGRNSATQDKFPRSVLSGTFDYGFSTGLSYKDVRLCVDEAGTLGVPMLIGAAVREMLAITHATFGPESDYTSMCRLVESWTGIQVRGQ